MIYEFQCRECGDKTTFLSMVKNRKALESNRCLSCGGELNRLYTTRKPIVRTSFPRNFTSEHVAKDPTKIRDEKHFRDIAAENDLVVTNPWDGI